MKDHPRTDRRLVITDCAISSIHNESLAASDGLETGGILLGGEDGSQIEIRVAGGPGPFAMRRKDSFLRDLDHAQDLADTSWKSDQSQWIGEWHTHPNSHLQPSPTDLRSYLKHLRDPDLKFDTFISLIATVGPGQQVLISAWRINLEGVLPTELNRKPS